MGDILATVFFAELPLTALLHDRTAVLRAPYNRSYSQPPGLFIDDEKRGPFLSGG